MNKMMPRVLKKSTLLILLVSITAAAWVPVSDRYFEILKSLDIFASLFKKVNEYYVDETNPATLIKTAIDNMLEQLDPYTNYISADEVENYRMMTTGDYSGIGAAIERKNGISTILIAYEGYGAFKAGLRAGDQIYKINGIATKDKTREEVRYLINGQSESEIELTIKRFGQPEMFNVMVKREKIAIKSVPYAKMIEDSIGYIRLTNFTPNVGRIVGVKTLDLIEQGVKSMILDLRGNPGGLLHEAVNISNIFLEKGIKIVEQKGKIRSNNWTYKALNEPISIDIPLVILTDNGSASASEIVSGVMQDYDRAVLVGRRTFGKGLVQIEQPLTYDAIVKITTAKYYTPSGRCIQAIDYTHRKEDGSVGAIPDSLKKEFFTRNKRKVYDGGGIDPDVVVSSYRLSPISKALLKQGMIFNYVTAFYYTSKKEYNSPKDVIFTDQDYSNFVNWMNTKKFEYLTEMELKIRELIKVAKSERYYEKLKDKLIELKKISKNELKEDLKTFKYEITSLLEQEIAGRYFFEKGIIESGMRTDQDMKAAIEILNDPESYRSILNIN